MKARAHIFVSGRVQGVFFRYNILNKAKKTKIGGWVRNLPDGRLEAVFEGKKEKIIEMIDFCRRGPPTAFVVNVDVLWQKYSGTFKKFMIG